MPRICITIPNKTPQPYRFPNDTKLVTIGRSAANDVVIDHGSVSSHHCEMKLVEGGYILVDTESTNGIHLDEEQMEIIDLTNGLDLEVGDVLFNYQLKEEEVEAFAEQKFKSRQRKKRKKKSPPKKQPKPAPAPAAAAPAPAYVAPQDTGGRDFAIFLAFALLTIGAFWLGLSSAHKKETKSETDRYGRSLWSDVTNK